MQAASAALAVYLLMQTLDLPETYLAILSAVYIVQPSVGGTMGSAANRIIATLVGSVISLICLAVLPDRLGTPVALVTSLLVINGAAVLKPAWQYGVVAAIALSLGAEEEALRTAIDRGIAIGLGATIGITASLIIWPESAAKRFERHLRSAM
ncbi:MAG: aluminum activated malate transporter family protein, partial [Rhodobacterales bacterium]|nr:aluminum activated malate transporter family protein [Rhodobacterales bacterium]